MLDAAGLRHCLHDAEDALLEACAQPQAGALQDVLERWQGISASTRYLTEHHALDESTAELARQVSQRTAIITANLCRVELGIAEVMDKVQTSCAEIMARDAEHAARSAEKSSLQARRMPSRLVTPVDTPHSAPTPAASTSAPAAATAAELQLNAVVLRRWFRENLSSPFPTKADKTALVTETNALATGSDAGPSSAVAIPSVGSAAASNKTITYEQVVLWFINARRRSGWTDFFRKFAWSDKARMSALVDALSVSASDRAVVEDATPALRPLLTLSKEGRARKKADIEADLVACKAGFAKLIDWVHQTAREKVGDWLDVVLAEAAAERQAKGLRDPSKPVAAVSQPAKREETPPAAVLVTTANATRAIAGRKTRRLPKKTAPRTPSPPVDPKASIGASPTTTSLDGQTKLAFTLPGAAQFSLRVPPPTTSLAGRRDSTGSRTVSGSSTKSNGSSVPSLIGGAQGISIGSSPSDASMSSPPTPLSMPTFQHMILHDSPLRRQQLAQQKQQREMLAVYKNEAQPSCSPGSDASSGVSISELSTFPSMGSQDHSMQSSQSSHTLRPVDASPDYNAFICASTTPSPFPDKATPASTSARASPDDSGFFENEAGVWDPFPLSQHLAIDSDRAHGTFGSLALHDAPSQESIIWRTSKHSQLEHAHDETQKMMRRSPVDEALTLLAAPSLSRNASQSSRMSS
jgi:hypothetical protein